MSASSAATASIPRGTARFFLWTFAWSWILQAPAALAALGLLEGPVERFLPLVGLGAFGPAVAAVLVARAEGGRAGVRALLSPLGSWRVGLRWFVAALAIPIVLLSAGLAVVDLAGGEARPWAYPPSEGARVVAMIVFPIAEEIGWRGLALPRLQARYGALAATAILGALWALWHVPMFLAAGIPLSLFPLVLFFFVPGSLFFTWLYNRTRGSLAVAVAAHVAAHLDNSHAALPGDSVPVVVHTVGFVLLAAVLLLADRGAFRAPPPLG